MGFTADGLPLIGRYAPGPLLAAGFNGGGFSWAPITRQVVADLVCGRESGFDLGPFAPNRLARGETTWNYPFTAGVS
jgi:glycine/D-amino acid oxidase-like deaminating enzyme